MRYEGGLGGVGLQLEHLKGLRGLLSLEHPIPRVPRAPGQTHQSSPGHWTTLSKGQDKSADVLEGRAQEPPPWAAQGSRSLQDQPHPEPLMEAPSHLPRAGRHQPQGTSSCPGILPGLLCHPLPQACVG